MLEADERLAARKHAGALLLLALFSCSRGTRETVLATDLISPRNLQVDGTHAYWLDGADGGVLLSVPVDGSARPTVLSSSSSFVDLDVDDSSIYWSDDAGLHVLDKVNLDAGPRDVLAWSSTDAGVPTRQFAVTSKGVVSL